jgi:acyl-CoA synthetase (AMP-forming)/AMP-acid ligase II
MRGLMQDHPLLLSSFLQYASRQTSEVEIVARPADGSLDRATYATLDLRARKLAAALRSLGEEAGHRVSTLAWNDLPHCEAHWAAPGIGAIINAVNFRLAKHQIDWICRHAGSRVLFADPAFAPIALAGIAMTHPAVEDAAVVAARHPTRIERPLLVVQLRPGATAVEILTVDDGAIPSWQRLDDVVVLAARPHSATGKVLKNQLRERFADHLLATPGPKSRV